MYEVLGRGANIAIKCFAFFSSSTEGDLPLGLAPEGTIPKG